VAHWVINGFTSCTLVRNNCCIIIVVWFLSLYLYKEILLIFGEGFQGASPKLIFAICMSLFYTTQSCIWTTFCLYGFGKRTLVILHKAKLGFFGVLVEIHRHTPCFWGHWVKVQVCCVRHFYSLFNYYQHWLCLHNFAKVNDLDPNLIAEFFLFLWIMRQCAHVVLN
jgi:hypothetical protein